MTPKYLDPELRFIVKKSVAVLGETIQRNVGEKLYLKIETIRKDMTALRRGDHRKKVSFLEKTYQTLQSLPAQDRFYVAHSFALMLEVMNTCENAYRAFILSNRRPKMRTSPVEGIFYVLTAHPTEARSPENVLIFKELQTLFVESLKTHFTWHEEAIRHLIEKAWLTPITRQRKPQVADEAEYIYSIALNPIMLRSLIDARLQVAPVFLRSWVGGDKDGHPGVNAKTMTHSLNLSRNKLLDFILGGLRSVDKDLKKFPDAELSAKFKKTNEALKELRNLGPKDGKKVVGFRQHFLSGCELYRESYGTLHPCLRDIETLLEIFPGLVVPLELRESSELIVEASHFQKKLAISEMLHQLKIIAGDENPRWYVRGIIISMCSTMDHIEGGLKLIQHYFRAPKLPVIPLFEQESALQLSASLVQQMLKHPFILKGIKTYWHDRLEIMLGYSDSAKEVGSLQSRLLIADTVKNIEVLCEKAKVKPVFFHGSGGSVDRGGGSIQEQTAWLSKESLSLFKATIQGEMVERTFSSSEIFRSGVDQLADQILLAHSHQGSQKKGATHSSVLREFADTVSRHYRDAIGSQDFLDVVQWATPYRFLSALKLGSRPSRRGKVTNVLNLRAIPWVLCWTQTRILFPVWWGTGRTWKALSQGDKKILQNEFKVNPVFRSYIKLLGFTLAKVELPIWEMYLRKSGLPLKKRTLLAREFREEYLAAVRFFQGVTKQKNLLWYRPWLKESIQLRSPMIHPLNLLQMIVMKSTNPVMMRECVAGIANGMLTTG